MQKTLFAELRTIISSYRWNFAKGLLFILLANLLLIFNPMVFRQALISLDPSSESMAGTAPAHINWLPSVLTSSIVFWGILLITIAFLSAYFRNKMRWYFFSIGGEVEKKTRSKIFNRIQSQSMAFFDNHGTGELLSRLTNDIAAYRDVLGPGILFPTYFLTVVIPGLCLLYMLSPFLTLIALIPLFFIPFFKIFTRKPIHIFSHKVQEDLGEISNLTQEYYSGIRIIKSYVIEAGIFRHFYDQSQKLSSDSLRLSVLLGTTYPFFTLITKIVTVLLVLGASFLILHLEASSLGAADFITFMWIQSYIFFPILMLGWVLPLYARGFSAYERLYQIYSEPIEVKDQGYAGLLILPSSAIHIKHLSFTYPSSSLPALNDLTLTIEPGSFIGITGPVGSGKSSLFKILNRQYQIPKGMVLIGEYDILDYPLEAFRRQMVTVEQVPFLFSKSIAENVLFGREEASREELELVARHADLHETVMEFPEQYETLVGERGVTLSGGQKQRVAMARAFLVNRSILLLDDIFSALDSETEKRIFNSMKTNFQGKTVLLITHRSSILSQMERVIYMHQGKVVEDGKPEELMQKDGYYAALVQLQSLSVQ
jgi:ATP-binding cassette subfamily B protein